MRVSLHIEAFSEGKELAAPERNEDAMAILPGRLFAVADGVSDKSFKRYDGGRTSGQLASAAVVDALIGAFGGRTPAAYSPRAVIDLTTAAIAAEYARLGIADAVRTDLNLRFSSTLALAVIAGEAIELLWVGDSGIRINANTVHQEIKPLDSITADLRAGAYHRLAARGVAVAEIEAPSRALAMYGAAHAGPHVGPHLTAADIAAIAAEVAAKYARTHPEVPRDEVETMIHGGIVNGQSRFLKNTTAALGYSGLDGFAVPDVMIHQATLARASVRTIELFTDGYFDRAEGFGVAAWEAMFDRIEREDAAKIGRYRSVKGSHPGYNADDRSYIGVRL